jgi:hypothetical protein
MKQSILEKNTQLAKFDHGASSRFASLKWKISLLSSIILLIVVTTFSIINYQRFIDNIDQQSDLQYQRYAKEVEKLIEQISSSSHQLIITGNYCSFKMELKR